MRPSPELPTGGMVETTTGRSSPADQAGAKSRVNGRRQGEADNGFTQTQDAAPA
ncbi:MAG: hypothetical protein KGS61_08425 [Verrucomicrobia bacterium]|nr:hypothetical protein [Verrucomicrobiota bacterium]